jgi:predicted metalloprotease
MATIINNPDSGDGGNNGGSTGTIVGIIVLVLIVILFLAYGLPAIRGGGAGNDGGTNVNVPESVDVNLNDGTTTK